MTVLSLSLAAGNNNKEGNREYLEAKLGLNQLAHCDTKQNPKLKSSVQAETPQWLLSAT